MLRAAVVSQGVSQLGPGYVEVCVRIPAATALLSWRGSCAVLQCLPTARQGCRGLRGMHLLGNIWSVVLLTPGTTTTKQKLRFLSLAYQKDIFPR